MTSVRYQPLSNQVIRITCRAYENTDCWFHPNTFSFHKPGMHQAIYILTSFLLMLILLVWGADSENYCSRFSSNIHSTPTNFLSGKNGPCPGMPTYNAKKKKNLQKNTTHLIWDTMVVRAYNYIARAILSIQKPKCASLDIYNIALIKWFLRAVCHLLPIPKWKLIGLWANCILFASINKRNHKICWNNSITITESTYEIFAEIYIHRNVIKRK